MGESTSNLKTVIDNLARNKVIDIRFTGGEVTVRSDWYELLEHAKSQGFVISVNTNGVYNDPDSVIDQLASLDLEQVTISIDGNREAHDFMRGRGSYDKSVDALKRMYARGIATRINCVLTQKNVNDVSHLVELASEYAREINFFHMRPVGRGVGQNKLSLNFDQHFDSAEETLALRERYPGLSIMHFEQSYRERSIRRGEAGSLDDSFSHGNTTINIDCFGGVWPNGYNTYQDERLLLGNLVTEDLGAIWNGSQKLEGIRRWQRAIQDKCKGCDEYLQRCPGLSPEMEIAKLNQGVDNNFCVNDSPVPALYGSYIDE